MAAIRPPTNFHVSSQTATTITLSWTNNDDYTSLAVDYGFYEHSEFVGTIQDISPQATSVTIADLVPNSNYQFKLSVTKDVELPRLLPPIITVDRARVFDTQIFFTVDQNTLYAVSTQVQISRTIEFDSPFTISASQAGAFSFLEPFTVYYLRGLNVGDDEDYESSVWSTPVSVRTTLSLSPPGFQNVRSTGTALSFTLAPVQGAGSYIVQVSYDSGFSELLYEATWAGAHSLSELMPGSTVYLRAKSVSNDHHADSAWKVTSTYCAEGFVLRFAVPMRSIP